MSFDPTLALTLDNERVKALAAVSYVYACALATEHGIVEQADGEPDLCNIELDDGSFAVGFDPERPPGADVEPSQIAMVSALSIELDARWLFLSADNARAALDVMGEHAPWKVADSPGYGMYDAALVPDVGV